MNKTKLKNYAPQARKDFIAAVSARANQLGLSTTGSGLVVSPAIRQGDVTLIEGRDWPAKVYGQRERLVKRMQREGFDQTVEAVAYTWFNRFAALRFMELHDYLEHGYRVLSSIGNVSGAAGTPDILLHAVDLAQSQSLLGLNADEVGRLKLAGNQDGELYRKLITAQCNALSNAMPFLFERIDDETELLLPDNLLRTDSVIAKLISEIPEDDWLEVEVIGWLYQFYISEKKDQVIGKVVKSEDIPAATQLFTPNWIVKYMVQNSVGRLWMMANPESTLKSQWKYYIEPAEQTPEVNAQLDALIKTRMDDDGGSLNPETITVLDPACGSGHILVEAYDLLKGIYLERGYRLRDIPRLILEKNLYGLDIDDRAAQMAGFALLMKARADDRRLLNESLKLNVLSLQDSKGMDLDEMSTHLSQFGIQRGTVKSLIDIFEYAKTFGSLIQIDNSLKTDLALLPEILALVKQEGDMYACAAALDLLPLVHQAQLLAMQFDAVVANPPYMGARYFDGPLKRLVEAFYKVAKGDLYTCFIVRNTDFAKPGGVVGMITIPNWMFLATFEELRNWLLNLAAIETFSHNGRGVFGSDFGSSAFTFRNKSNADYLGCYKRLFEVQGSVASNEELHERFPTAEIFKYSTSEFMKVPGCPIAYWISDPVRRIFQTKALSSVIEAKQGLATANNERFIRLWHELDFGSILFSAKNRNDALISGMKWFPYNKGGEFRKWFGNQNYVVNWENDGSEIKSYSDTNGKVLSRPQNIDYYFRESASWTLISSSKFGSRYFPYGFVFDINGMSAFSDGVNIKSVVGFLNSSVCNYILKIINPSMAFQVGDILKLPGEAILLNPRGLDISESCIKLATDNLNDYETSWNFKKLKMIEVARNLDLRTSWEMVSEYSDEVVRKMVALEEENNEIFINAYGLQNELSPEVLEDQITLSRADREKDSQRLISYVIGCMMGRYSLDEPGLIYAHSGNLGFNETRYKSFSADTDGIVPITDELWFEDDASNRIREFVKVVWGPETLEINMAWLAESLGKKANETPDETIRRYLADKFCKDHLQTYKKRPIYWLFSSGKQGAFQALVYLHRYHEGTLARMRAEYVVPLTGKIQSRIEMLEKDALSTSTTAARTKINKDIEKLKKQHVELLSYDEKLRHYADMRIKLDLDDGVKVNYGKFGDLLDSVKAITGGSDE
jgi:hypothetical protein